MFLNDQLTRRERLRLESLNMALRMPFGTDMPQGSSNERTADAMAASIFRRAEEVERWLLAADQGGH